MRPWPDNSHDERSLAERLHEWGQEGWELVIIVEDDFGVQTFRESLYEAPGFFAPKSQKRSKFPALLATKTHARSRK